MSGKEFRRLALSLEGATEGSHMGHPDFRRDEKIFATLNYPDPAWGMVKLSPEQQDDFVRRYPDTFVPVKGGWGRQGCTNVRLEGAGKDELKSALGLAWARAEKTRKSSVVTARKRTPSRGA